MNYSVGGRQNANTVFNVDEHYIASGCDCYSQGKSIIGLAVQCPDGKYSGAIRAPRNVYDHVLEFLKRNHGRKLREVIDADMDISDLIQ